MRYIIVLCIFLSSCTLNPLRIFEAKVPAPLDKPPAQIETERRGADLIARKLKEPFELKPVAIALSASLGAPKNPIEADTPKELAHAADTSTNELRASIVAMQVQISALNKNLAKYQGKEIEGTGFSLLGPGITTILIGLIILAVMCPPALTLMAFAYRRLKGTASTIVAGVEAAANAPETKDAIAAVKAKLSSEMDQLHKNVVLDLKKA